MKLIAAIVIKYLFLGVIVTALAIILGAGIYSLFGAFLQHSILVDVLVSLLVTVAAVVIVMHLLHLVWVLYATKKPRESNSSLQVRFACAARHGDLSDEWFKTDHLVEIE